MTQTIKKTPTLEERFWKFVSKGKTEDDCWSWSGAKNGTGYGKIATDSLHGPRKAHRVSYMLHYGIDPIGMHVCHKCDNPECCNPKHLFLGTHAENIKDSVTRGRWIKKGAGISRNKGSANGMAKCSDEQVQEIRDLLKKGDLYQRQIAKLYGVSQGYISEIKNGKKRPRI